MYKQPENEPEFVTVYCVYEDWDYNEQFGHTYFFSEEKAKKHLEERKESVKKSGYSIPYVLKEIKVEK